MAINLFGSLWVTCCGDFGGVDFSAIYLHKVKIMFPSCKAAVVSSCRQHLETRELSSPSLFTVYVTMCVRWLSVCVYFLRPAQGRLCHHCSSTAHHVSVRGQARLSLDYESYHRAVYDRQPDREAPLPLSVCSPLRAERNSSFGPLKVTSHFTPQ